MNEILANLTEIVQSRLPNLLLAVGVLVVGWLIALIIAAITRAGLKRTSVDDRIASWLVGEENTEGIEIERWIGRFVFWVLMLFVFVGFFQVLGLTVITEPLNRFLIKIFEYLPHLIGPAILLLVAWVIATGLRFVIRKVLTVAKIDERLGEKAGLAEEDRVPLARALSDAVYWLIFLLFLPAILSALNLNGLLQPVQGMIDEVLAFLPNLFAAALIGAIGWLLARVIQRLVSNLFGALGVDRLSQQVGLETALGEHRLSNLLGLVLYILILIPVLIAALNALHLDAITRPASDMLNTILSALPMLFGASLVLVIAFFVGRVVAGLITNLLTGFGFDAMLVRAGITTETEEDGHTPSEIMGNLALVAIMLFATIEGVRLLGFEVLAALVAEFMVFAGHVALGLIIFGIGMFLAHLAAKTIEASGNAQAQLLATAARISILVLAGAMALRQMGLANEIITLAFGLLLGSVAVAFAIAFGIGGREVAAQTINTWMKRIDSNTD